MEISELSCGLKKYYWTHGVRLAMVILWIEYCLPVHILSILKYANFNDFSRHHKNVKISSVARTGVFKDSVRCVVCKTCSLWWGPTLSSMLMCKSLDVSSFLEGVQHLHHFFKCQKRRLLWGSCFCSGSLMYLINCSALRYMPWFYLTGRMRRAMRKDLL